MCIKSLSHSLECYDMEDVSQILPEQTVQQLNEALEKMFVHQVTKTRALEAVAINKTDNALIITAVITTQSVRKVEKVVESIDILTIDMVKKSQDNNPPTQHMAPWVWLRTWHVFQSAF